MFVEGIVSGEAFSLEGHKEETSPRKRGCY